MLVVTAFCTVLILWKGVVLLRSAVYVTRISASRKGGPIRGSGKPARPARLGMPCVSLVMRIDSPDAAAVAFHLNLMAFDCVMRASSGYIPQDFYSHDIRKITNFLGRLAEAGRGAFDGGIGVIVEGVPYTISIDEGDVIQVSGGPVG